MFRFTVFLAVLVVLVGVGEAATVPTGPVIAETGFNDASGINSDVTADSPYQLNYALPGQPSSEPGWAGPWRKDHAGASMVQDSIVYEGDGAALVQVTSNNVRNWSDAQTAQCVVECRVRFTAESRTVGYIFGSQDHFDVSMQGPKWAAMPDGSVLALDGDGLGAGTEEITGFSWTADRWYKFTEVIDVASQTWQFFVDDVEYVAPDPLGFRGSPSYLDGVRFLSEVSGNGTYIEELRISAIPEPSTVVLLGMGAVGLLVYALRKKR